MYTTEGYERRKGGENEKKIKTAKYRNGSARTHTKKKRKNTRQHEWEIKRCKLNYGGDSKKGEKYALGCFEGGMNQHYNEKCCGSSRRSKEAPRLSKENFNGLRAASDA